MSESGTARPNLFVSHTGIDVELAKSLSAAVDNLMQGRVTVSFSTKRGDEGAIPAGADWFEWIGRQVRTSRVTVVLLTPNSVAKPWVLWETGAIYGAAISQDGRNERRLRPLLYGLTPEDLPGPLVSANLQTLRGDDALDMQQFFSELVSDYGIFSPQQLLRIGGQLPAVVDSHITQVRAAMDRVPDAPVEAAVEAVPALAKALSLTVSAIQALDASVKINGRYFHAVTANGREYLDRVEDVYVENEWLQETGLRRVDVEEDSVLAICQSHVRRTPVHKVLSESDRATYRESTRYNIDPQQGWVLACPVLARTGKSLGVLCFYGKEPPVNDANGWARFTRVAESLANIYSGTLEGTALTPGRSLMARTKS